jgi:hypothetical protein
VQSREVFNIKGKDRDMIIASIPYNSILLIKKWKNQIYN